MTDFNKRIKKQYQKIKSKKIDRILIQNIIVEEVLDETAETEDDTIIRISFDGILIHLPISVAMKLNKKLTDALRVS